MDGIQKNQNERWKKILSGLNTENANRLKQLLDHLNKAKQPSERLKNELLQNLPKYINAICSMSQKNNILSGFDVYLIQQFKLKVGQNKILEFMDTYCRFLSDAQVKVESFLKLKNNLAEILKDKNLTQSAIAIEFCLIITRQVKSLVDKILSILNTDIALQFFKFITDLTKVIINCDSTSDRGFCSMCKNTKRHATDHLLNNILKLFDSLDVVEKRDQKLVTYYVEQIKYKFSTVHGLSCDNKNRLMYYTINLTYKLLSDKFWDNNMELSSNRKSLTDTFNKFVQLYKPKEIEVKHIFYTYLKAYTTNEDQLNISCLQLLYENNHETKKALVYSIIKKRDTVDTLKNRSILDLIKKSNFKWLGLEIPNYDPVTLILLEMEATFCFTTDYKRNYDLFCELQRYTTDSVILGHALFLFELTEHNNVNHNIKCKIEQDLKGLIPKTFKTEAILTLITIRKYVNEINELKEKLRNVKYFTSNKEDSSSSFDHLCAAKEESLLDLLFQCFTHINNAVTISSKEQYETLQQLYSYTKFSKCIEQIAAQFAMRGLSIYAMKCYVLLHAIATAKNDEWGLITSLTYFMENPNQCQFIDKLNLSIPEVASSLINLIEKHLEKIYEVSKYKQSYLLSGYQSLVEHFIETREMKKVFSMLSRIENIDKTLVAKDSVYKGYLKILRFKKYLIHHKLFQVYSEHVTLSPFAFLFTMLRELDDIVEYRDEFSMYIPTLMFKMFKQIGLHQTSRYETKTIEMFLLLCFKIAARLSMNTKCIEILLLLTYLDFMNENLNEAEEKIKNLETIYGYEQLKILKKTPGEENISCKKVIAVENEFQLDLSILSNSALRRDVPQSPKPYILSPPVNVPLTDFDRYLTHHPNECRCLKCKVPHLKFYVFILGCYYARLLYMNEHYEMAYKFYKRGIEHWWHLKRLVDDYQDHSLSETFTFYSFYMQVQMCHCLMRAKKLNEAKQVCSIISDLFKTKIFVDKAIIEEYNLLLSVLHNSCTDKLSPNNEKELISFDDLITNKDIKELINHDEETRTPPNTVVMSHTKSSKTVNIYTDSPTKLKLSSTQKKRLLFSKKKDTLDSPHFNSYFHTPSLSFEKTPKKSNRNNKETPKTTMKERMTEKESVTTRRVPKTISKLTSNKN